MQLKLKTNHFLPTYCFYILQALNRLNKMYEIYYRKNASIMQLNRKLTLF